MGRGGKTRRLGGGSVQSKKGHEQGERALGTDGDLAAYHLFNPCLTPIAVSRACLWVGRCNVMLCLFLMLCYVMLCLPHNPFRGTNQCTRGL